jgi:hypothetical protein
MMQKGLNDKFYFNGTAHFSYFSLIREGATEKVSQFTQPNYRGNKRSENAESKCLSFHLRRPMTFSITILTIKIKKLTASIMTLSIMTLRIMTLSIMTLSIMTLSIMTLNKRTVAVC